MKEGVDRTQGQISEEMSRLQDLCDTLHRDIDILTDRIFPVLKEDYPSPSMLVGEDVPVLVPLAQTLRDINDQLIRAHLRLSDIDERISL